MENLPVYIILISVYLYRYALYIYELVKLPTIYEVDVWKSFDIGDMLFISR